jgi:hypothetical protein
MILDIYLDNDLFLDKIPKVGSVSHKRQMGLHQTTRFLHREGHNQQSKEAEQAPVYVTY